MINQFNIKLNFDVKSGSGSVFEIIEFIIKCKFKNVLIVLDKNLKKKKYVIKFLKQIKSNKYLNTKLYIYSHLGEPTYEFLEQEIGLIRKNKTNIIVGIGGGSCIDFAKAIALLITNKKKPIFYRGFPENLKKPIPIIAVPTTAGTGTEIAYNAVFISKKDNLKLGINYKENYPIKSYLDPVLIKGTRHEIIIISAVGALIRSLDSLTSPYSSFVSRYFSIISYSLIISVLRKFYIKKNFKINQIIDLQWGALFSMMGLSNSSSGPSGSVSYFLSVNHNLPQGLGYGLAGIEFIKKNHLKKKNIYFDIVKAVYKGKNKSFLDDIDKINKLCLFCLAKIDSTYLTNLEDFQKNLLNFFKNNPKAIMNLNRNNPVKLSLQELKQIFHKIEKKIKIDARF